MSSSPFADLRGLPFEVGSMKHSIYCNDEGLICAHAILQRSDEHEYRLFATPPWPHYRLATSGGRFRVEMRPTPAYLTQVAGPTSLETLERATGEDVRDIGFLRFRTATIAGKIVEIARIGMSGNLAYELRGPLDEGAEVYDAVYRAGQNLASSGWAGGRTWSTTWRAASHRWPGPSRAPAARTPASGTS